MKLTIANLQDAKHHFEKMKALYLERKRDDANEISLQIAPFFEQAAAWEKYLYCLQIQLELRFKRFQINEETSKLTERAVQLANKHLSPDDFTKAQIEYFQNQYYFYLARYEEAITGLHQILERHCSSAGREERFVAHTYLLLCYIYHNTQPDAPYTVTFIEETIAFLSEHPKKYALELGNAYCFLGGIYMYLHPKKSLKYFKEADKVLQSSNALASQGNAFRMAGTAYYEQADYDLAIDHFQKAHVVDNKIDNKQGLLLNFMNIGNCYAEKEEWKTSIYYLTKAEEMAKIVYKKPHIHMSGLYISISITYTDLNQTDLAHQYVQKSLQICKELSIEKGKTISDTYANLAHIYFKQNNYSQAITNYQAAITHQGLVESNSDNSTYKAQIAIAKCYFKQKKQDAALSLLQQTLQNIFNDDANKNIYYNPPIENSNLDKIALTTLSLKADLLQQYYAISLNPQDLVAALFTYQLADSLFQKIRSSYTTDSSKLNLGKQANEIYKKAVDTMVTAAQLAKNNPEIFKQAATQISQINQANYPTNTFNYVYTEQDCKDLAFNFCEKSKGLVLLDNLLKNKAKIDANIPAAISQQESELQAELHYLQKRITQAQTKLLNIPAKDKAAKTKQLDWIADLQVTYANNKETYQELLKKTATNYPKYHEIKHTNKLVNVAQVQAKLTKQQSLINYHIGTYHISIFIITKNTYEIFTQKKPANFDRLTNKLQKMLNQMRHQQYVKVAYQLYQLLVQPIAAILQTQAITDLLLIPHESLHQLPFECLITEAIQQTSSTLYYHELPYFIQQYNISYHYSATLFSNSGPSVNSLQNPNSFVGFAPVYADTINEQSASKQQPNASSQPSITHTVSVPKAAVTRSVQIGDKHYDMLKYSEEEVLAIQQLFEQKEMTTEIYLHEKATVEQLKTAVKNKHYIHIAAHGYENDDNEEMTGIILSPNKNSGNNNDDKDADTSENTKHILYLNDSYALQLNADLVVLSCCKSGIGKVSKGEGMMAMNRGFLYAGAKNVLYTLFKVYDEASSQLTQHFFQYYLQNNSTYSQALQQAKLKMIETENYTPKHWAGFVLIGS